MADFASGDASPQNTTPVVATPTPKPRTITRTRLTPERLDKYVETLALTGSHFEACRVASPYANERAQVSERRGGSTPPSGYATFLNERKANPDFARRCDEAIAEAIGRAESELARRMMLPTERPTIDKNGNVVHIAKDFRNADLLLGRFLARHRPQDWIERKAVDSNVTVHNGNGTTPGACYVISIADVELLSAEHQAQLMDVVRALEDAKAAAALPPPDQQTA